MLPKNNRLTHSEFPTFARSATKKSSDNLFINYTPGDNFKAGVVVSKKVSKKAVDRNRMRRVLYSILAQNKPMLPQGMYVVRVKNTASEVSAIDLKKELRRLLGQIEKSR